MKLLPEPYITDVIQALEPKGSWHISGDSYAGITWHSEDIDKPTEKEVTDKTAEMQAAYDAQEYARNRAEEYPSVEELTIALYDADDKATIDAKRAAVKKKWPKDNSGPVE